MKTACKYDLKLPKDLPKDMFFRVTMEPSGHYDIAPWLSVELYRKRKFWFPKRINFARSVVSSTTNVIFIKEYLERAMQSVLSSYLREKERILERNEHTRRAQGFIGRHP